MIQIRTLDNPPLSVCKMMCDAPLHKKLNEYELTKFLNNHSTTLIIGKPGSGKTSLLYSFFKSPKILRKVFHNVFLVQPAHSAASIKNNIFNKLPENKKFNELDYDTLAEIMARCKAAAEEDENSCIILDDCSAALKNKDTMKLFKELVFNRRHIHTSIYFLTQTYYSVPKEIRRIFSNIFVFKTSKTEMENIFAEQIEQHKDYCLPIMKTVFDEKYNFLMINTDSQRLFKNWDELVIDSGENNVEL